MNSEDARAIKSEISRQQQGFTRQAATVVSYSPYSGRGGIATVHPDGPNNTPIEAVNTTGVDLGPNDRVMLDFDPPAGVYVLGVITSPEVGGSCEPMAGRCHATLDCSGYSYFPGTGDYLIGGTTIGATTGLFLPDSGVWHVGFNIHTPVSTGFHMGQGRFTVANSGSGTADYAIVVSHEDDTAFSWVTGSGAVDHAVPFGETGLVTVAAYGGTGASGLTFLDGIVGLLYAHRIECTADLV